MSHPTAPAPPLTSPSASTADSTPAACPLPCCIRVAAFIFSAPCSILSTILDTQSEDELRATLDQIDPSDPHIQPNAYTSTTCTHIYAWIAYNRTYAQVSSDIVPLSLLYLVKFVLNAEDSLRSKFHDSVWIGVAFKLAQSHTSDKWMKLYAWENCTNIPRKLLNEAELVFLKCVDWDTWVKEDVFTDFVGRFNWLMRALMKDNEAQ